MTPNLFWVQELYLKAEGMDVGFGTFSAAHFIWLALMAAGIALFAAGYRRCGARGRDNMRKALALFIILFEILKICVMALTDVPVKEYLPLEVCSFAEYSMLVDALWPQEHLLRQPFLFLFLPSAFMALMFPTVVIYPPVNFYTIHQFVFHSVIAAYVIARYAAGELRPRYAGLWTSMLEILVVAAPIYWIDLSFNKEFMFLTGTSGNPVLEMLWGVSGGTGGLAYIGALVVFILLVLHVVFALYSLIGLLRKRKSRP